MIACRENHHGVTLHQRREQFGQRHIEPDRRLDKNRPGQRVPPATPLQPVCQRPVRDHNAFGLPGCPRGVDQIGGVIGEKSSAPVAVRDRRIRFPGTAADCQDVDHRDVAGTGRTVPVRRVGHHHSRRRVLEQVGDSLFGIRGIDRQVDAAGAQHRSRHHRQPLVPLRDHGDVVADVYAHTDQMAGQPVHPAVELCERPLARAMYNCDARREVSCSASQQPVDRDLLVHGRCPRGLNGSGDVDVLDRNQLRSSERGVEILGHHFEYLHQCLDETPDRRFLIEVDRVCQVRIDPLAVVDEEDVEVGLDHSETATQWIEQAQAGFRKKATLVRSAGLRDIAHQHLHQRVRAGDVSAVPRGDDLVERYPLMLERGQHITPGALQHGSEAVLRKQAMPYRHRVDEIADRIGDGLL